MKKVSVIVFILFIVILFLYILFLFFLPVFLNSGFFIKKLHSKYDFEIKNYKFKTSPNLDISLNFENFIYKKQSKKAIEAKNSQIEYSLIKRKIKKIRSDYLFLDINNFKKDSKKPFSFNFNNLTNTEIKKALIILNNDEKISFEVSDFKTMKKDGILRAYFICDIKSKILKYTPKIGQKGSLILDNYNLQADNLEIKINNSSLFLNGDLIKKTGYKLTLSAKDFPVGDTERLILYFMKLKNKKKQFLENFKNFKGTMDVNLTFQNKQAFGLIDATNLSADTVLYNIPIIFKKAQFIFQGKKITSNNKGLFGGEDAILELDYDNLFTKNLIIKGYVKGNLTQEFSKKYLPDFDIINYIYISLNFYNKHKKPDVNYTINLDKSCDIVYKNITIANKDTKRKVYIQTHKEQDFLKIEKYIYFDIDKNATILEGNAFFQKKNKKMKLKDLSVKAPDYVLFSSKNPYARGYFKGDLKFNFKSRRILGDFILKDTFYKGFYLTKAQITAQKQTFYDLWKIKIEQISYSKFKIEDIFVFGNLKNDIFNFELQNKQFAKGTLFSKGKFNTKTNDIEGYFEALNIDSNIIASNYFNLKNQIEGLCSAKFCAKATDDFKNIKADIEFEIKKGKLLKLANIDFIFKQSNKNKPLLLKLINISNNDLEKLQSMTSDVKGSFKLDNQILKCINIKVKQDLLSLFLEGSYDIDKQLADFELWAKMNKQLTQNIKILFIPVNWIINIILRPEKTLELYRNKTEQIPPIVAQDKDIVYYGIKVLGDINKDIADVKLKRLTK